ncbi:MULTISPECIES: class I SAM-dependent methyltransferase [unclassified Acinetobacter]|uniref:class I SAM-dependent methyltransferase n=1 Tax=unclassified Acinetobacter TaxID=196816 RepID=UPI0015D42EA3|nr:MULTISPECIES: class I SAM-dependent methyltransferase [unclassified Acinetobacter]
MKDLFSTGSALYQQSRPSYSAEVVDSILQHVAVRELAWDCGAGSGQFTKGLAPYFQQVLATDLSAEQLAQAPNLDNVRYEQASAEHCPLADHSVDLITVAQAIHWFDFAAFYAEVRRVLKPHGHIAIVGYGLIQFEHTKLNQLLQDLYFVTLKGYWDVERRYIDEEYRSIPFPFQELATPQLFLNYRWSAQQILDYLQTWSGLKHYQKQHPTHQPCAALHDFFSRHLQQEFALSFPVLLRIGTV